MAYLTRYFFKWLSTLVSDNNGLLRPKHLKWISLSLTDSILMRDLKCLGSHEINSNETSSALKSDFLRRRCMERTFFLCLVFFRDAEGVLSCVIWGSMES